ncbi:MAG: MarR family transcriptional regulator [Proteobacteria bacterium]|nr:MarR family transcriptional regulator [Pseudomonadota bacterium]
MSETVPDPKRSLDFGILTGLIGYQLRRAQVAVFGHFADAFKDLDLTPGQLGALALIHGNPGLSQSALGGALGVDRSTVVPLIDRLETRALVVRAPSPKDRRSHALQLSPAGARLLAEAEARVRAHEAVIAARLSEPERRTLLELLARIGAG